MIGRPNDKYEQEADAMANQVMRGSQSVSLIQKKCTDCEREEGLQRKNKGQEDELQTKSMLQKMAIAAFVEYQS